MVFISYYGYSISTLLYTGGNAIRNMMVIQRGVTAAVELACGLQGLQWPAA